MSLCCCIDLYKCILLYVGMLRAVEEEAWKGSEQLSNASQFAGKSNVSTGMYLDANISGSQPLRELSTNQCVGTRDAEADRERQEEQVQ